MTACALFAAILPVGASADASEGSFGQAGYSVGLTGFVPVICHASVDASNVPAVNGTVSLGRLQEFCNSPGGYRVIADYSSSLAHAKLLVDGRPVLLDGTGSSVVSLSSEPAVASHQLELQLPDGVEPGMISFRIEPL